MILIVGLGNPGSEYENTRHNIGFIATDLIAKNYRSNWLQKSKFQADISAIDCEIGQVILCKPNTFMNLSGRSVQSIASFYKIPLDKIIVIHDDIDLKPGKIKHKIGGGSGGHNGLKSLDSSIGRDYHRIRIGVGRPDHPGYDVSDYVLGRFSPSEKSLMLEKIEKLIVNLKYLAKNDLETFKKNISIVD